MAGRRPQQPPPLEVKQFTTDEIDRGIAKLKKRLADVKALDPSVVPAGDL